MAFGLGVCTVVAVDFYVVVIGVFRVVVIAAIFLVVVDGGEGAEQEVGDVGEDGGAAWGDAAFGEEMVEGAEGVVDALGPLKGEGAGGKSGREIFGVAGLGSGVTGAEGAVGVDRGHAALAAGGGAVLAALRSGGWAYGVV